MKIGILHPGAMGVSIAASAINNGHEVYWTSDGRSEETRERASHYKLRELGTLDELCATVSIMLSVCPPNAAEEVAREVRARHFRGTFLDANAIAPQRAIRIGEQMNAAGIDFVDGSILGGPAWTPNSTWMWLSGRSAQMIADCFAAGPLETCVMEGEVGKASALKMCYAAYTKGTTALLGAVLAAADSLGVREELYVEWGRDDPTLAQGTEKRVRTTTAKAWRFVGEMEEIAETFRGAGLPGGFHDAAAEIYRREARFKGLAASPSLEAVLQALLEASNEGASEGAVEGEMREERAA